jgi:hypothetical protein
VGDGGQQWYAVDQRIAGVGAVVAQQRVERVSALVGSEGSIGALGRAVARPNLVVRRLKRSRWLTATCPGGDVVTYWFRRTRHAEIAPRHAGWLGPGESSIVSNCGATSRSAPQADWRSHECESIGGSMCSRAGVTTCMAPGDSEPSACTRGTRPTVPGAASPRRGCASQARSGQE